MVAKRYDKKVEMLLYDFYVKRKLLDNDTHNVKTRSFTYKRFQDQRTRLQELSSQQRTFPIYIFTEKRAI